MPTTELLLCTDLDRTLLPNGKQPEHPAARPRFRQLCAQPNVTLAYVTGRHLQLVEQAIAKYAIPCPDFVITDVGTKIYQREADGWREVEPWQQQISSDWQGKTPAELHQELKDLPGLTLQEEEKQSDFKLSYYAPLGVDSKDLLQKVEKALARISVAANLIWSIDEPAQTGLLDVLPASASKLHAIEFLQLFLHAPPKMTIFAGDSGNDLPVLTSTIQSVLVANADEELKLEAQQLALANGHAEALFLAREDSSPLGGNYSAGILQGVAHFAPQFAARLSE